MRKFFSFLQAAMRALSHKKEKVFSSSSTVRVKDYDDSISLQSVWLRFKQEVDQHHTGSIYIQIYLFIYLFGPDSQK